jgi:hypothetical protein
MLGIPGIAGIAGIPGILGIPVKPCLLLIVTFQIIRPTASAIRAESPT